MALELVYTSAPSGIKPGTRGFCTVACSRELPGPLAMTLESLSGYRHLFAPNSENARFNLVVRSHMIFKFNGSPVHLLSRIADAGYDYSQRTNKIAHHVVLRSKERPEAGPAELLARSDLFIEKWNKEPTIFPQDKAIPKFDVAPAVCSAWRQITGDAGWGGILAAAATRRQPVGLIFKVGQDVFPLYREAIALLPPNVRWETTFSTFYSKMSPGFDCLWRAVLLDSHEEPQVRAVPNSIFLDLTRPLGNVDSFAKDSQTAQWIEAARTGTRPQIASQSATSFGVPKPENATPFEELSIDEKFGNASKRVGASPFTKRGHEFGGGRPSGGSPFAPQIKQRRKKSKTRFILPLLFILALIGAVGAAGYFILLDSGKNGETETNGTELAKVDDEKGDEPIKKEPTAKPANAPADQKPAKDETNQKPAKDETNQKAANAPEEKKADKDETNQKAANAAEEKKAAEDFLDEAAKLRLPYSKKGENYKKYEDEKKHAKQEDFAAFSINKIPAPCKNALKLCHKNKWHIQVKLEPFFKLAKFTYKTGDKFIGASNTDNNEKFQYNFDWLIDGASDGDSKGTYTFLTIVLDQNSGISIYHNQDKEWHENLSKANLSLLSTLTWQIVDKSCALGMPEAMPKAQGQVFEPFKGFKGYQPLTFSTEENTIFNEESFKKEEQLFNKLIPDQRLLEDDEINKFYFSLELYQGNPPKTIEKVDENTTHTTVTTDITVPSEIISPLTLEAKLSVNNNQLSLITNTKYKEEGVNKVLKSNYENIFNNVKNDKNLNEQQKAEKLNSLEKNKKDEETKIDDKLQEFSKNIGYRILLKRKGMSIVVVDVPPETSKTDTAQPAKATQQP